MARSAEAAVVALLATSLLAGCTTTQQKSARAEEVANRLLASRQPLFVKRVNPRIEVRSAALIRGSGATAVVVELHNRDGEVAESLPINVGLRAGHYLNRGGGFDYLATHVPAIPAGGDVTWVFTTSGRPAGRKPFARVGFGSPKPAARVPEVQASVDAGVVRVSNASSIPQYGLGVFEVAHRGGRVVAAGRAVIHHLGTGASVNRRIPLVGRTHGATLTVSTAPSTLR